METQKLKRRKTVYYSSAKILTLAQKSDSIYAPKENNLRPDMKDIKYSSAANFLQFCRDERVETMAITWDDLDREFGNTDTESHQAMTISELSEDLCRSILLGKGELEDMRLNFLISYHEILNECYNRDSLEINRIKETDINTFLEGKPVLSYEEVMQKLPMWLRDHNEAFLPQNADKLPPHRVWDHKIELIPGKEPPYNRNRPLSVPELKVVRK
ncbi:hypothetical protein K3495_g8311 [Podosphaera aphanis]|nr:hypothetical protein K3495_g8311 [Podosphaera aphanis]